jgi:hypothetical protein
MTIGDNADWVIKFMDEVSREFVGGGDNQVWIGNRDIVRKGLLKFEHEYEFTNWFNSLTELSQDQKWNLESTLAMNELAFKLNNKLNGVK